MKILLYNISKDINSTALPSGEAVELTGNLRLPSSVENPVIEIEADALPDYNYAYIPAFSRYYWINNRGCSTNKLFVLSMSVDPLATFATEIGASTQYVLRAADDFDGTITDTLYPTKNSWVNYEQRFDSPFGRSLDTCYWCVGVKGSGADTFYCFTNSGFNNFMEYLLAGTDAEPGESYTVDALLSLGIADNSEAAAVLDPLQYITSITCLPTAITGDFTNTQINIGFSTKTFANCQNVYYRSKHIVLDQYSASDIGLNPQSGVRGAYLNNAPYAEYYMYIPGFGKIDIDPSVAAVSVIDVDLYIDPRNGECQLTLSTAELGVFARHTSTIGVPFEFSQIISKGTTFGTALGQVGGVVASGLSGNVIGAIAGAGSFIQTAINNKIPYANSVGSTGCFAHLAGNYCYYVARFAVPVAEDNAHRGRPLCARRRIGTLSGYIMCADTHIHPEGATTSEISAIESAMNSGFYYESEAPAPSPAIIEQLSVTANGTYTASSGVDGYSPVIVNVPQGITPSGTISITENDTYDVTQYAEAVVNVSGGGDLPNVRKFTVVTDATLGANGGIIVPVVTSGRAIYALKANAGTVYRPYYCGILSVDYSQSTKAHHVAIRYDNSTSVAGSSLTITNGEVKIVGGATWHMQEAYTVDVYEVIL